MQKLTLLLLMAVEASAQIPKPVTPKPPMACYCDGHLCSMPNDSPAACRKIGGQWRLPPVKQEKPPKAVYRYDYTDSSKFSATCPNGWWPNFVTPATVVCKRTKQTAEQKESILFPLEKQDTFTFCDKDCSAGILTLPQDPHGCGYSGTWDEGKQACAISLIFPSVTSPITCSPVSASDGQQRAVCWYVPVTQKPTDTSPTQPLSHP